MSGSDTESQSRSTTRDADAGYVEYVLTLDAEHFDRLFAVTLLVYFAVLIAMSPQYAPDSRLFPLVIGVPTLFLLGVLLIIQSSSRVSEIVARNTVSDVVSVDEPDVGEDTAEPPSGSESSLLERRKRLVEISLWMLLLFGLVLLVGFLPAIFVYLLGFYRSYAGESWLRSLGYTVIIWVTIVLIFDVMMGTRFYEGVLEISLPFL